MPRIRFTQNFDFRLSKHAVRAYEAGKEYLVSQACAKEAIETGKAAPIKRKDDDAGR